MCFAAATREAKESKKIDKQLKGDKKNVPTKILLLGTGNTGKSTFCKQLTAEYGGTNPHFQMSDEEVVLSLRDNVVVGVQKLVEETHARSAKENKEWPPSGLSTAFETVRATTGATLGPASAAAFVSCFQDPTVQNVLEDVGHKLALPGGVDGLTYFMKNINGYCNDNYVPSSEDKLRNRIKTTGIIESQFAYKGQEFVVCDVGGQRSERRKWIHCFNGVDAIIYLTSVNDYDVSLEEASNQNALIDSIQQLRIISELQCFTETPFMVFFNKFDLLPEKIKKVPLSKVFRDYDTFVETQKGKGEADDVSLAINYFKKSYSECFGGAHCDFYTTCALDRENCKKVFNTIYDFIVGSAISDSGLGI